MSIVTRATWSLRPPKLPPTQVPISARTATCVHHAGAVEIHVSSRAQAVARVRADQRFHLNHNGWDDLATTT